MIGVNDDVIGRALAAGWDWTGDIRLEVVAGSRESDAAASDGGVVRVLSLFPALPATYCSAKANSLACSPTISYTGSPSLS